MKFVSNAKYDKPVLSGTIFEGKVGNLRISVHRIIHCDGWYLSCYKLGIDRMGLKSDNLIDAIEESKRVLKMKTEKIMNDVDLFCAEDVEISRY